MAYVKILNIFTQIEFGTRLSKDNRVMRVEHSDA